MLRWRRQHLTRTSPVATFTVADSDVVPWRTVFVGGQVHRSGGKHFRYALRARDTR